ncbi:peptide-methionine (S)-S-oxide reductase [Angomonas deanei]|uniref:peptide-methionine (S)-S-oxide reductase n=1 Tax=Angomonas deanei TaxID=59799 RepID=A0A7G2C6I1_9TRYP|nr:peptide-methionine (S)-S-oxide reductase [Angomonas deanei]CAD2215428.1 Peptide methionine sulfoxide reductase, putative [Angomonas deanei]|eukprot:EPY20706.1 peptide-methionine (S)-S-oxide reductase [Angomonas deanei]
MSTEEIYLAGGCLWGVQEFVKHLPGVTWTEAGRANGTTDNTKTPYDGYAECVRVRFDPSVTSVEQLLTHLFEIIDPYSVNQQGRDVGLKYRTGVYSTNEEHLKRAKAFIASREDADRIALEVLPLTNYVPSDEEHQNRLSRCPEDHSYCHVPMELLQKYKKQ